MPQGQRLESLLREGSLINRKLMFAGISPVGGADLEECLRDSEELLNQAREIEAHVLALPAPADRVEALACTTTRIALALLTAHARDVLLEITGAEDVGYRYASRISTCYSLATWLARSLLKVLK